MSDRISRQVIEGGIKVTNTDALIDVQVCELGRVVNVGKTCIAVRYIVPNSNVTILDGPEVRVVKTVHRAPPLILTQQECRHE